MKVNVNGKHIFNLSDIQEKVIMNDVHADVFDEDMKRRLQWILMHKYERCFKRLKEEWDPKLKANGVDMIPTDPDKYAELVFSQPNYMDCKTREERAKLKEEERKPVYDQPYMKYSGAARRGELA